MLTFSVVSTRPYYVYMTAGANKFLRIYYGKVNVFFAKGRRGRG